ncbi:MAG: flagellar hook-length control protein FliK, partial [Wenzhouxiangella sp.]
APAQSLPGESPLQNLRADSASPLLAAQSAAPPREPALPPTAQLLGQPGATAGEMRAAAEQAMQRVIWMAAREQGISQARLQLHPAHLGKVDVQLEVNGREANVVLNVQNGPVREAMEAMLPRLREQLEQQGINLGDASVFDADSQDAAPEERKAGFAGAVAEAGDGEGDELPVQNELNLRGRGLLDAYA